MQRVNAFYRISGAVVLISLIIVWAQFYGAHQTTVVTFDKELVLKQFITQLSHKNVPEEKTKQLSDQFARALKNSLDDYAKTHHAVVIKKEMVLATHADVTPIIAERIAKQMRGGR